MSVPDDAAKEYNIYDAPPADDAIRLALDRTDADRFEIFQWMLAGVTPLECLQWRHGALRSLVKLPGPDAQLDGVWTDCILATLDQPNGGTLTFRLEIGRQDRFLRRVTQTWTPGNLGRAESTYIEAYSRVQIDPDLPGEAFAIVGPPGFKPVARGDPFGHDHRRYVAGAEMPAFSARDLQGKLITSQALRGRACVLVFSYSHSLNSSANLRALYARYRQRGLDIVSFIGRPDQPTGELEQAMARHAIAWPVVLDADGSLFRSLGIRSFNFSVIVGRDGRIIAVDPPMYEPAEGTLIELFIRKALGEQ
jgi:peroxiredoxin